MPVPTLATVDLKTMLSTCVRWRAEGHADAELVGALHHGVGDDAVESDGGERKSQRGKAAKQPGHKAAARPLRLRR